MKRSLQQIAEAVGARLQGDGSVEIAGVASIVSASAEDLVFVEDEKYLPQAVKSPAGAIIAGEFATAAKGKPLLISKHPKLAFARASRFLQDANRQPVEGNVHATASMHPSARLAPNVRVEPQVVIAEQVEIGAGSWIGAGCVIGSGVRIGQNCEIHPRVTIYPGTT
ncbi:MAG: LpxD N-terminal domain-containing protein, partial [Candidatus Sulfotelmatobacter sp.]